MSWEDGDHVFQFVMGVQLVYKGKCFVTGNMDGLYNFYVFIWKLLLKWMEVPPF